MNAGDQYNLERSSYHRKPLSGKKNQWDDVPSINSDITKEIDALLNY